MTDKPIIIKKDQIKKAEDINSTPERRKPFESKIPRISPRSRGSDSMSDRRSVQTDKDKKKKSGSKMIASAAISENYQTSGKTSKVDPYNSNPRPASSN